MVGFARVKRRGVLYCLPRVTDGVKGVRMNTRRLRPGVLLLLGLLLAGCAQFGPESSPPGPGVPRIANLRFEPETIPVGGTTQMSFYFEVGSADLEEGFLIDQGIAQFQLFTALQPINLDLSKYSGQVAGVAEVPLRWSTEGLRYLEVYVVTRQGNVSNRLRAPLTVR
jgi:hypothetical protein